MSKELIDALQTSGILLILAIIFLGGAIYWTFQKSTLEKKKVYGKMPFPAPWFGWLIAITFWAIGVLFAILLIASIIGILNAM